MLFVHILILFGRNQNIIICFMILNNKTHTDNYAALIDITLTFYAANKFDYIKDFTFFI
jgi:hypothetical protein